MSGWAIANAKVIIVYIVLVLAKDHKTALRSVDPIPITPNCERTVEFRATTPLHAS